MRYAIDTGFIERLNGSLEKNRQNGKILRMDVGALASKRVIRVRPDIEFGKSFDMSSDRPRIGRCVLMGFTNAITDSCRLPTGIAWMNAGPELDTEAQLEIDLGLGLMAEPEIPRYLAFRATREHVQAASEWAGYPPRVDVPSSPEGLVLPVQRGLSVGQYAMAGQAS